MTCANSATVDGCDFLYNMLTHVGNSSDDVLNAEQRDQSVISDVDDFAVSVRLHVTEVTDVPVTAHRQSIDAQVT